MLRGTEPVTTARSSRPQASSWRRRPQTPKRCSSSDGGSVRTSPKVRTPSSCSRASVAGPTPHMRPTGSGSSSVSTRAGGTMTSPSGFSRSEASLARNLFGATPTDAVSAVRSRISCLRRAAMTPPASTSDAAPLTSRKASSMLRPCTSGVQDPRMANTCADASR